MNKIICIVLFFISGILIYQILKLVCKCSVTEGYGEFGRVNLDKCCPKGYKYSKTMKKCVNICDACDPSVYNKLTYEYKQYPGDSKPQLRAYFDCEEHDASTVHDYDSINRRYTKEDLLDQNNYGGWNMNSDFFTASVSSASGVEDSTGGIQAAEEGSNETWSGISTDASTSQLSSDTVNVSSEQQHYFEEIPEELYYTSEGECINDYTNFSSIPNKGNPPEAPGLYVNGSLVESPDCRGYWKLDMEDQRFNYLKDGDRSIAQPSWRVYTKETGTSRNPGYNQAMRNVQNPPTFEENRDSNLPMVYRYISSSSNILNSNSPVYEYYLNNFLKLRCIDLDDTIVYPTLNSNCPNTPESSEEEEREDIIETLNNNRLEFCNKLDQQITVVSNGNEEDRNQLKSTPFVNNNSDNYNTLCSEVDTPGSLTGNSINKWDTMCDGDNISFENTNDEWKRGEGDNLESILCISDVEYLCASSNGLEGDTLKTFCDE